MLAKQVLSQLSYTHFCSAMSPPQHKLKICFSIFDFLWLQEHPSKSPPHPHEHVLHFAAGREAFLHNVLIPLFGEFRAHPAVFAWEIANEPEWAIREFHPLPEARLHLADFRAYAAEIAEAVHGFGALPATLGCACLAWVRAWTEIGLDYYQAHYYPSSPASVHNELAQQLAALPALDRPLWLGELPAGHAASPSYSLSTALSVCRDAGLCGAAVWRWTEPDPQGSDAAFGRVDPTDLLAWSALQRATSQLA